MIMVINPMKKIQTVVATTALIVVNFPALAQVRSPPQSEWDKATADVTGADAAARTAATAKIKGWLEGGWVSMDLWKKWLPALVKANDHQEVAELAFLGILSRPGPEAMSTLLEFRVNALLALQKNDDALQAAKSYYNACDIKYTAKAVDMVALALARAHPEDLEIVRRFRSEQAAAAKAPSPASGQAAPATASPMLLAVKIDEVPYKEALQKLSFKTRFSDRVGYGNLLLAADKGQDAEKVFRELFQMAATQGDLTTAAEGIAKSLRAQDGNVARANAWLIAFQQQAAARPALPAGTPAAKPKDPSMP
jgi:hypothetical protein